MRALLLLLLLALLPSLAPAQNAEREMRLTIDEFRSSRLLRGQDLKRARGHLAKLKKASKAFDKAQSIFRQIDASEVTARAIDAEYDAEIARLLGQPRRVGYDKRLAAAAMRKIRLEVAVARERQRAGNQIRDAFGSFWTICQKLEDDAEKAGGKALAAHKKWSPKWKQRAENSRVVVAALRGNLDRFIAASDAVLNDLQEIIDS